MTKLWDWITDNSLLLAALGVMAASQGLEGVYTSYMMPRGWPALGFIANGVADIATLLVSERYAKLQRTRDRDKRRLSRWLLPAEAVALLFSWLLSWRQLRIVLPLVEPDAWQWLAPIFALMFPLTLASLGLAQGISVTRFEKPEETNEKRTEALQVFECPFCERFFDSQQALAGHKKAHRQNGHKVLTEREKSVIM